jgi:hypothetical protein
LGPARGHARRHRSGNPAARSRRSVGLRDEHGRHRPHVGWRLRLHDAAVRLDLRQRALNADDHGRRASGARQQ